MFFSTSEAISENGPYDIIFANSVLCHHPSDVVVPEISSFSEFEKLSVSLHDNRNDAGLLCLYNLSYQFRDLPFADKYKVVSGERLLENGFVSKWAADGSKITEEHKRWPFRWQFILKPELIEVSDFTDCMYCKTNDDVTKVMGDMPRNNSSKWVEQPPISSKAGAYFAALGRLTLGKRY